MTNNKLSPLQSKLLDMMKWFHEFCESNNIRYYVLGGTMLGAARHQGFIPWDDDIDVGLPRKDYEKLAGIMKCEKKQSYVLETPYSDAPDFCYPYSKIYDTRTTLIENRRRKIVRGVFLDVFPLDGLGDDEEECRKNYETINKKYNLLLTCVGGLRKGRSLYKNLAVVAARFVPRFLLDDKKMMIELDRICAARDFDTSNWICNDLGAWRIKEAMPRSIMGNPTRYKFEDMEVYGAEDFDGYLTCLYGDWRKLPPVEKRVSHHDFVELDLNRSYLE